jgi:osmotically-inducible protein OsmY
MIKAVSYIIIATALGLMLEGCAGLFVAGAATGATVAEDRRSADTILKDEVIETKALNKIFADEQLKNDTHINVTSMNRNVLLTGEAKTDALRTQVAAIVKGIEGVKYVDDEIAVAEPASLGTRTQDTWLTAKVKAELLNHTGFDGMRIKVVSERGNVYLMGLVTQAEAAKAVAIASQVDGVQEVVKVFEYVD